MTCEGSTISSRPLSICGRCPLARGGPARPRTSTWMTALLGDAAAGGRAARSRPAGSPTASGSTASSAGNGRSTVFHCHWEGRWDEAFATADQFIREIEAGQAHYMEARFVASSAGRLSWRGATLRLRSPMHDWRTESARGARDPQTLQSVPGVRSADELGGRRPRSREHLGRRAARRLALRRGSPGT